MNALTALPDLTEEHVLANLAQEINEEHAAAAAILAAHETRLAGGGE